MAPRYILEVINAARRRRWHPTPVLLPGKSHGWRSLIGCSPWGHEELDMTERLHFHFSLLCIGEGNGNPLQCSCLENPRDGGVWWAAVYGVAQSPTRLKWLSSIACLSFLRFFFNLLGWRGDSNGNLESRSSKITLLFGNYLRRLYTHPYQYLHTVGQLK